MPDYDERWKRVGFVAVCIGVAGVVLGVSPLILPNGQFVHNAGWQLVLVGAAFVLASAEALRQMAKMRERLRLRSRALSGDAAVMPPARLAPDPSRAADVLAAPLSLLWLRTGSFDDTPAGHVRFALLLGLVPLSLVSLALPFFRPSVGAVLFAVAMIGLSVLVGWIWPQRRQRNARRTPPEGVIATERGLTQQRADGSTIAMAWGEARLWEVSDRIGGAPWRWTFTLYGVRGRISWPVYAVRAPGFEPVGFERAETADRAQAFLDVVAAHTKLPLRTLSFSLMDIGSSSFKSRLSALTRIWRLVGAGLAMALIALAAYLIHVSGPSAIPGFYVASSLGLWALIIAIFTARSVFTRGSRSLPKPPAPYTLSVLVTVPQLPVAFPHAVPFWRRLTVVLLGIVSLPTYVAVLFAAGHVPVPALQVAGLAALIDSLAGFGCLLLAWHMSASTVTADEDGLIARERKEVTHLAWDEIARVEAYQRARAVQFAASSADESVVIFWNLERGSRRQLPAGVARVTAEEFAAIVCQHSGKPFSPTFTG